MVSCFLFQAEDGIRGAQESRGLGDVYKRQVLDSSTTWNLDVPNGTDATVDGSSSNGPNDITYYLSLIHI